MSAPLSLSAEDKTELPVQPSRTEPVEKPEQKPPAETPKAEVPLPVAVAPAQAIEANKTPETKGGPKGESPPPVAVVPPQEIEPKQTTGTKEKPKAESTPAESSGVRTVQKTEAKPAVGDPKAEAGAAVAVVSPQEIEPEQTTGTKEKPKAESIRAESSTSVTYPFSLYLGSVPHLDQAAQGVLKYTRKELPVYFTEVALSKGIWYRLYAGYFESEEQAEGFKKEKRLEEAEVKETPFTNLIGTFTSQDKLESEIQSLKGLGFSPYVIKDADGKQRLLVGAFYNEERAKRQYEELKSKGVENQIVQR
jgi:hypothetical protein